MSIFDLSVKKGPGGFGYSSTAEQVTESLNLKGKTIFIDGCNSGIGKEALRVLTMRSATVIAAARTFEKAKDACDMFNGNTIPLACELSDPSSVLSCVDSVKKTELKLDAIICFAGIMALPKLKLIHGYEAQFFINHISHFMLVTGLLEQLSDNGRVIMLSSDAHKLFAPRKGIEFDNLSGEKGYKPFVAYGQSKLANLLFSKELARYFIGTQRISNAVHPGAVNSGLDRNMNQFLTRLIRPVASVFVKTVAKGAATPIYAAVHPDAAVINGYYFADCDVTSNSTVADDAIIAKRLWEVSEQISKELILKHC
jgi:WW domain-containing oxidoreductase